MSTFFDKHYGSQASDGHTRAVYKIFMREEAMNARLESKTGYLQESTEGCYNRVRSEFGLPPISFQESKTCRFCKSRFSFKILDYDPSHGCAEERESREADRAWNERQIAKHKARIQSASDSTDTRITTRDDDEDLASPGMQDYSPFIAVLVICFLLTGILSSVFG